MLFRIQRSRKERTGCAVLAGVELTAASGARPCTSRGLRCTNDPKERLGGVAGLP